ncbi:DUF6153 family protein [Pseudonocardia acaciae]|uniref:DUF6153 family protein n=1 Tax=Pseudonocardia acaciae TaxID=551276 RepID=UPI000685E814|nr:DUF6153 family protein [Pseudonocardia acaciae]
MTGWRATSVRWSLVLAIAAGLVAMHSLMLGGGGGVGHESEPAPAAAMSAMAEHPAEVSAPDHDPAQTGHGHHGDGPSALLHLCLAVLGTLLLALAAPLLLAVLGRRATVAGRPAGMPTPCPHPRAPPPTSVRLAELCVSLR